MQTYYTYFKREFAKKHGNSSVLARFVLFLSGIADSNVTYRSLLKVFAQTNIRNPRA